MQAAITVRNAKYCVKVTFSRARRVTFTGSRIPISMKSPYFSTTSYPKPAFPVKYLGTSVLDKSATEESCPVRDNLAQGLFQCPTFTIAVSVRSSAMLPLRRISPSQSFALVDRDRGWSQSKQHWTNCVADKILSSPWTTAIPFKNWQAWPLL